MNVKNLFQGFNPSKLLVYACLLLFSFLLALKLDGNIAWSYWGVFMPIWFWKFMAICGASVGSYIWWRNPQYRIEGEGYVHYKAMMISVALHVILLMFEMLVCNKLENVHDAWQPLWTLVFIPLVFVSIIAIAVCIWGFRHDRAFEMELFSSVNILQFIFIPLRLDEIIGWSWVVILIPTWIVLSVALIGVLYAVILAIVLLKSPDIIPEQRRGNVYSAVTYTMLVIPLLVWLILLCNKLDGESKTRYVVICLPLYLSLFTLMVMSFGSKGGNHWWFGIRKDFCQFLLGVCPLLQEYGNISYTIQRDEHGDRAPEHRGGGGRGRGSAGMQKSDSSSSTKGLIAVEPEFRPVVPVVSIETPD